MKRKAGRAMAPQGQGPGVACGRRASAGAQRQRQPGPALLGASFIYVLLSKNAINRGFLRFSKSVKCCQVLATKKL